jgi:hypothetical protein
MTKINLPVTGGYNRQPEFQADSELTINLYTALDKKSKTPTRLRHMPGHAALGTFPGVTGGRGACVLQQTNSLNEIAYVVVGSKFFSIDNANTITFLGTLATSTGYVKIVANQLQPTPQILIVDGVHGYIWNGSTFTTITAPAFPGQPIDAEYLDGHFIVLQGESPNFFISPVNDGLTWSTALSAQITSCSDVLIGVAVLHRRLFIFGKRSYETWYSQARGTFPFQRDNNVAYDFGCAATGSITTGYNRIFFLATSEEGVSSIMRITGSVPEPVSTSAIEYAIHRYTHVEDATSYLTRTADGHLWYVVNFTQDNVTWVYDEETDEWYQRQMLNGSRYIGQAHFFLGNVHHLIGYNNNILYQESDDIWTHDGAPIPYIRRLPVISDENFDKIKIDRIKVDYQKNVGLPISYYEVPILYLAISKNGGATFPMVLQRKMAPQGDFKKRTIFKRLGTGRDIVLEFKNYSKNNFTLFSISIDYEVLLQ